jgi:hypothetical protein
VRCLGVSREVMSGAAWLRTLSVAAVITAAGVAGCGGADTSVVKPRIQSNSGVTVRYVAAADRICADAVGQLRLLGPRLRTAPAHGSLLHATTEVLVKPALKILEREASRVRALGRLPQAGGPLHVFVELMDPIDVLLGQRLTEGERGDADAAHQTETLVGALFAEQENAARQAGLRVCSTSVVAAALGG